MSITVFLLWIVSIPFINHVAPQSTGFLLNCGSSDAVEEGNLKFLPDDKYIKIGNKTSTKDPNVLPRLSSLRHFPDTSANKYCYIFPVIKGAKLLVKTTYYYGGFDGGKEPPIFNQFVDGTTCFIVNTTADYAQGLSSYYEVIVASQSRSISVCLARNEHTISSPFISSIELHYLDDSVYNSTNFDKFALITVARHSFGSGGDIVSYPDDKFNRYWHPFVDINPVVSSQSNLTSSASWNIPPVRVFSSAMTTSRGKTLTMKWPPFPVHSNHYYIALYFHDNRTPSPYSWRIQNININGDNFFNELNVTADEVTVYSNEWPLSGQTEIALTPRQDMPVGPLISAGEVFQILPLGGRTHPKDEMAMDDLARSFENPPPDWYGDPCLPKRYSWTGVACSGGAHIRVISLNLTNFGLQGTLPASIGNLTALSEIWLGHNSISGKIPDMSHFKALKIIHLEDNKLEGQIPASLSELPELHEIFLQNNNLIIPKSLMEKKGINIQVSPGNHV